MAHGAAGILRFAADALPLLTAAEMAAWDAAAQQDGGVPGRLLMESAGRAAAAVIDRTFPEGRVLVAVGKGNNGGDGVVAARALRSWGRQVTLFAPAGLPDPALLHGWEVERTSGTESERVAAGAAVVVDALLGTGATGPPSGDFAAAVRMLAASGRPVVALDGPTGVDLTGGGAADPAITAVLTITFGAPKRGLLMHPGRAHAGRIVAVEIGLPPLAVGGAAARLVTPAWAAERLPRLPPDAHKGVRGTVGVLAGSEGMAGAAQLAGRAALRAGAGKVLIASHPANREILQQGLPEALFAAAEEGLPEALLSCDAVVAGPGLGRDARARALLAALLEGFAGPLLLDADALVLLGEEGGEEGGRLAGRAALLTPHPREMAALLGGEVADVTRDPFAAAAEAAERYGCAALLKGAPSLVCSAEGEFLVPLTGHSGVAAGGMGDVLSGVAGAFLGQGASPADAGALALHLSGLAAELAGRGRSLLPGDVCEALPDAFAWIPAGSELQLPGLVLDLLPRS